MTKRGNQEGSVYLRASDGRWCASFWTVDQLGRPKRKTLYASTQREAVTKLRAAERAAAAGAVHSDDQVTVAKYLQRWLAESLPGKVTPGTIANYRWAIDKHIVPALGHTKLSALRASDVQRLVASMVDAGYAPSTVMRVRMVLVRALGQAERFGNVPRNVAKLTDGPRQPKSEGRALTIAEASVLVKAATGYPIHGPIVLMLFTGLRGGELRGLRWSDVDLTARTIRVNRAARLESGKTVLAEPKTVGSRRTISLPDPAVDLLSGLLPEHPEPDALVFPDSTGGIWDGHNFRRAFRAACQRAGLGAWHPHEIRHSAASFMLNGGVPLQVVSEVLGHASVRMTADVYGHISPAVKREAADRMSEALRNL